MQPQTEAMLSSRGENFGFVFSTKEQESLTALYMGGD